MARPVRRRPARRRPRASANAQVSVLVVDDFPDGRELLVDYLTFRGFTVGQAAGGHEAIAYARALRPDVILMDLRMPGLDGWETTRRLKSDKATRKILIVAVTAHALQPETEAARQAGCDAVVARPFDLTALADAVGRTVKLGAAAFEVPELTPNREPQ